ncbi:ATP-binding cassette domain-containing protein [Variovorax sp. OV084]|uniref:branched-chain amino acid ABC transporter ATP-binding protein/permease n=1 Tax=Variovorax sp. OV084 TaxID=1882777 RepID=UPI0008CF9CD8|nr:branched-chain amino acid ABC transporter ATP-binding protein/permease [Variovorax sp. OV084]SET84265.1 amino acid/amide ABC transporter membrane protein 2, HAAT family /amino acid/amide ABC transporter ATP-binding protein 1, HAAT family [Variovorax sp. OV084]
MKRSFLLILAAGAGLAVVPWLGLPAFYESILYLVLHWVALATSWNLLSGYSGYFSFGHGAFFGIGMYTTATLATRFDIPFLWTLPAAAVVAALFGTLLGAVAFRVQAVRAELFSLLTLAATFVVATIILNTPIDGGPGVYMSAVAVPQIGPTASGTFYLLALGVAVLTVLASLAVYHSRFGTGLFAIHDDEDVAEVMGVPTYRFKLGAFALSCGLAGVVGGVHALFVSYVTTGDTFTIAMPLTVVLMSVLGGTRHWAGPIVGATAITLLLYAFTGGDSAIIGKGMTGLVLIVVILFMPEGLLGQALKWWNARRGAPAASSAPVHVAVADEAKKPAAITGEVLLRAEGVRKSFKGVHALRGVSLEVRRGEILGLLGPNGSGKSTFINVASGHYAVTAGVIEFEGRRISGVPAHRIAQGGIARTYQIPRPFAHLTVLENVALPAMFGAAALDRRTAEAEAWQWLAFTGLTERAHALPAELNLHQRKFLEFARALASRPQVLMLDEVLSGLTPSEIDEAVALIRRIRDQGATIVFVEHVMRAVMALCDRIVVFNRGEVLAEGAPHDVMQRPEVVSAYLGQAMEPEAPAAPTAASSVAGVERELAHA